MFSLICVWINGWVNNREAGDLRRHRAHYDVIVMIQQTQNRDPDAFHWPAGIAESNQHHPSRYEWMVSTLEWWVSGMTSVEVPQHAIDACLIMPGSRMFNRNIFFALHSCCKIPKYIRWINPACVSVWEPFKEFEWNMTRFGSRPSKYYTSTAMSVVMGWMNWRLPAAMRLGNKPLCTVIKYHIPKVAHLFMWHLLSTTSFTFNIFINAWCINTGV